MSTQPDHIYRAISAAVDKKARPKTKGVQQDLYELLATGKGSATLQRCHDIYSHEFKRETLEALFLVGTTPEEIHAILKVPTAVSELYLQLFFDPTVFEDELDVIDYAKTTPATTFGGELKQFAVDLGKECLKTRLARGKYVVDPEVILDSVRSTAFMMTQVARINRADSSMSNAALRWAQVGLRAIPDDSGKDDSGVEKLQMALETFDDTTNEEKSGITRDKILH